jgi:ABC-2 type transport system permease protein
MSVAAPTTNRQAIAPLGRMLWKQTRAFLLSRLRTPAFSVLSLGLPVMFFLLFNAIYGSQRVVPGVTVAKFIMVSYATYAVGNIMVFNFGIGVANDRGRKLDLLQRAMPLPPLVVIASYIIFAFIFSLIAMIILGVVATVVGGVRLDLTDWLSLTWRLLAGSVPLIALGMAIGYGSSPNTAPALANMVYLPMLFLSGIFVPLKQLPHTIQQIGSVLPTYHYAQLAWGTLHVNDETAATALLWILGWTIVLFAVAFRLYRLDEGQKFT